MSAGVSDLEVRYGRHRAVAGVSFQAPARAVTALVGGDGAGKTSVLRALVGAVRPAAGTVSAPEAGRVGYVSTGPGIWLDLTVGEHLQFTAAAYGLGHDWRGRAGPLLERTGLAPARDRLAGRLSGGMRQKLALACALLPEPELLVLDEATTGVDPLSRAELWRLLAQAAAGGAAVVLATTYLDEAERAAALVVLDRGRQLAAGSPEQLVAATPGAILEARDRPGGVRAWRLGRRWRVWSPDGVELPGAARVPTRLEDAIIVATLAAAGRRAA
ncbi:MAG TPA: ABC transporter ATP-binding protein [Actinomycetes bacterium]|nr:ABC transporter ATP-binding protein [Actinomycetes bacterium]